MKKDPGFVPPPGQKVPLLWIPSQITGVYSTDSLQLFCTSWGENLAYFWTLHWLNVTTARESSPAKSLVGTSCGSVVKCEIINEKRSWVRSSARAKVPLLWTPSQITGVYVMDKLQLYLYMLRWKSSLFLNIALVECYYSQEILPAKSLVRRRCGSVVKCEIINEKRSRICSSAWAKSAPAKDTKSNNRGLYYRQFAALSIHHEVKI